MIQFDPQPENPSADRAECFIGTTAAIILAATAAASTGSSIYLANKSSDTAKAVAGTQVDAANHAADDQKASADAALAFQRQQAEADFQNAEATRRANYDQYLNRYHAAASLAQSIGFQLPEASAYVPQTDPGFGGSPLPSSATTPNSGTTTPGGTPSGATGAAGSGNPNDPAFIQSQLSNLYRSLGAQPTGRGTGPTDIAYYADQIAKSGGWQGNNIGYWQGRIASDLKGGGASGGGAPGTGGQMAAGFQAPSASQLFGVNLSPYQQAQGTGQVTPPGYTPFQPTLGSAFGGR